MNEKGLKLDNTSLTHPKERIIILIIIVDLVILDMLIIVICILGNFYYLIG